MREKLYELINNEPFFDIPLTQSEKESRVDYLLANGVIVLPCKLRDTVYCIRYDKARKPFIKPLEVLSITLCLTGDFAIFTTKEDILGKTVFLTREEAEKALARMNKEGYVDV